MSDIEPFDDGQKQLAELLRLENAKVAELRSTANADPAQIVVRTEQLLWNLRIFNERQASLSFVREVPMLIEQRLFALSQMNQKALQ